MRQVKIFYGNDAKWLEDEINAWLKEHDGIQIVGFDVAQSGRIGEHRTVFISYIVPSPAPYR